MAESINEGNDIDLDKESQLFQSPQNNTEGGESGGDNGKEQETAQTPDQKPAQPGGESDQESGEEQERKPAQVPQEFDPAALNVPAGIEVNQDLVQDFGKLVGEMNLSQEQAQQLVDLQIKTLQVQEERFAELRRTWVAELKADPEYGGKRFDATVSDALAVMRRFDPSGEVAKTLNGTGFGDNPAIVKMLANIKQAISEDEFVAANGKTTQEKHLYHRMWPDEVMGEFK